MSLHSESARSSIMKNPTEDDLSCYLIGEDDPSKGAPLVILTAYLLSPGVQVSPRLEEVQEAIMKASKIILSTAKGISQWLRGRKQDVRCS